MLRRPSPLEADTPTEARLASAGEQRAIASAKERHCPRGSVEDQAETSDDLSNTVERSLPHRHTVLDSPSY